MSSSFHKSWILNIRWKIKMIWEQLMAFIERKYVLRPLDRSGDSSLMLMAEEGNILDVVLDEHCLPNVPWTWYRQERERNHAWNSASWVWLFFRPATQRWLSTLVFSRWSRKRDMLRTEISAIYFTTETAVLHVNCEAEYWSYDRSKAPWRWLMWMEETWHLTVRINEIRDIFRTVS